MNGMLAVLLLFLQSAVPGIQSGSVSGRVLNLDGTPAARMRVAAQFAAESPTAAADAPVLTSIVQTDAQGNFRLEGMMPGRFYITAGLVDLPTYYPGVTSISEARVVTLKDGDALTGIDFKMARPAGLTVRGRVKLDAGAAMPPNARVVMSGGTAATNLSMIVPADGTFAIEGVPPGRYTVGVTPAPGSSRQQIVLSDKDVDIELVVKPTIAASGKVVVEGDGPRPRVLLRFFTGTVLVVSSSVAQNGSFNVQVPLGNYRLDVGGLPAGYRLKSVTAGSLDWIKDEIVVQVGKPLPEFVIALDVDSPPPWVKVKGRITGGIRSGLIVTLIGSNAGEILRANVGGDNTFEFPRVIPGPYTARVEGLGLTGLGPNMNPTPVTVGSTDLDNLELAVPQTVDVRGRLIIEGNGRLRGPARLTFTLSGNGVPNRSVSTAFGNNTFSLTLPVGEYSLNLNTQQSAFPGYSVKTVTYGSANALAGPIKVSASDVGKELVVTLEKSAAGNTSKVSGHVTNAPSGSDIRISILGTGFNIDGPNAILADGSGAFEIPDVPPGTFTLRTLAVAGGIDVSTSINVLPGKDLTGIEIPFPSHHVTDGKVVLDSDGAASFQPRFWLTLTGARTITIYTTVQNDGSFTARLPIGDWRVNVGGLPNGVTMKSFTYGDTNLITDKISVNPQDSQQLRMVVRSNQAMVKVAGRVILSPQTPIDRQMNLMGDASVQTTMNPDGTFDFGRILPGTYSFCCTYGFTSITIPNRDVTDLTLRGISGHVVMESGTLGSGMYFQANDGRGTSGAGVGRDGSFTLILAEGSYRLQMSRLAADTFIKSIRYGSKEVSNQTFVFTRDVDLAELTVTLSKRP